MIPLKDYNPTSRFPFVTVLLLVVNVVVYFGLQQPMQRSELEQLEFTLKYAAVPCEVVETRPLTEDEVRETFRDGDTESCDRATSGVRSSDLVFPEKQVWAAVLYSMFLHGSLLHIAGNMLYLWVFGNNIEDRMGPLPYLAFYLASGLAATVAHVAVQPSSTVPVIGASGAIAGVMGAYLVLFPNVEIRSLIIYFVILFRDIRAKWLLGFWFVFQFFTNPAAGVAWVAHVGGFVFGAAVAWLLRDRLRPAPAPVELY